MYLSKENLPDIEGRKIPCMKEVFQGYSWVSFQIKNSFNIPANNYKGTHEKILYQYYVDKLSGKVDTYRVKLANGGLYKNAVPSPVLGNFLGTNI